MSSHALYSQISKNPYCFFKTNTKNNHKIKLLQDLKSILTNPDSSLVDKAKEYKLLALNFNKNYKFSFQSFFSYISDTAKIFLSVGYLFDINNIENKNISKKLNNNPGKKLLFTNNSGGYNIPPQTSSYEEFMTDTLDIGIGT